MWGADLLLMKLQRIKNNNQLISTIIISILLSWAIAFPFEQQILHEVSVHNQYSIYLMVIHGVLIHLLGVVSAGFFFRSLRAVKKLYQYTILLDMITCIVFFLPPSFLWQVFLYLGLFFSGCCTSTWAVYWKAYTPVNKRIKTAADYLITNNSILILIGVAAFYGTYQLGLTFLIFLLAIAFLLALFLPEKAGETAEVASQSKVNISKAFMLLSVFILLGEFTIGLTFQFILPAYSGIGAITNFYWAIPYILTLVIMRIFPWKFNRNYMLYISIAFIGFAFIDFMLLGTTYTSFFIVCTKIFVTRGIFDLFWWGITGELLEFSKNPVKLYGGAVLFYIVGQLVGGNLGYYAKQHRIDIYYPVAVALGAVLTMMLLLPLLQKELSLLLKSHSYLSRLSELEPALQVKIVKKAALIDNLTEREGEIVALLMQGRTYKMISAELFLSENTVKTHIKNIYSKLQVKNKTELINTLLVHQES